MRPKNYGPFRAMGLMTAILSQLAGSVLIGIFAGRWLDNTADTEPLFLILGLVLGLAAGIYTVFRLIQHFFMGE